MLDKLRTEGIALGQGTSSAEMIDEWIRLLKAVEQDPVVHIPDHFVMIGRVFATLGGLVMHYRPTTSNAPCCHPSWRRFRRTEPGSALW
jgi:hypothetical protein